MSEIGQFEMKMQIAVEHVELAVDLAMKDPAAAVVLRRAFVDAVGALPVAVGQLWLPDGLQRRPVEQVRADTFQFAHMTGIEQLVVGVAWLCCHLNRPLSGTALGCAGLLPAVTRLDSRYRV